MGASQPRRLNCAGPTTCHRAAPTSSAALISDSTSNCQGVGAAAPVRGARNKAARNPSRIQPHKFAGINFTEYFRCKHCGKHFAIVSYTPILLVAGSIILTLTALTVGLLYAVSGK